ncbi:hypothetical protein [Nocardia africana]|uniref:Uncharacterized protein n=1 Tax=Nocardia africana TaxID=134964 RepID=A0ABW6NAD5_9NOCA
MFTHFGLLRPLDIHALSLPPHTDSSGTEREGSITIYPHGQVQANEPNLMFDLSYEEAEQLGAALLTLAADARKGIYNEEGKRLIDFSRAEDLKRAWVALMREEDEGSTSAE